MSGSHLTAYLGNRIAALERDGLFKSERVITSPQGSSIELANGNRVLNFCANNYLGLANEPDLIAAAKQALDRYGYGLASVRFICGTQEEHKMLEDRLAGFLGFEGAILYSSCFDANTGLFETLFGAEDAIISDALNHASIIDGVRLCKARRLRYANNDMDALEARLQEAADARFRVIVTDGVFSMDGTIADLAGICDLADRYDALMVVDDSHAVGLLGKNGRGTPEYCGVEGRIDLVTGTLGKALGGASGGYICGKKTIISWLRQRSRPYLFSNTLAPVIAATSLRALDLIEAGSDRRTRLWDNTARFRSGMSSLGFNLIPGSHPIVPIMVGDAVLAQALAEELLEMGIYVTGFSFPVVPRGAARVRAQISAAHTQQDVDQCIECFSVAGKALGIIT